MTDSNLMLPTGNTQPVSLREQSTEALIQAIHSPGDEAYVLNRTRVCLSCFYEPDMAPADKAAMMDEFGRALRSFPRWAVSKGFDAWMKTATRRPSPGEIAILAEREVKFLVNEVEYRRKNEAPRDASPQVPRVPVDPAQAEKIMALAGWTPKRMEAIRRAGPLVGSIAEAESKPSRTPHWSETASPDDPRFATLQKAREAMGVKK